MLKGLFVLKIFTFLSWRFDYVEKRLDKKAIVNFKIYDDTDWTTNNYNTHIIRNPNVIILVSKDKRNSAELELDIQLKQTL